MIIQRERGDYWENSHSDLDAQFNDLRARFEQIHLVSQNAMAEIENMKRVFKERHATVAGLVTDREAWILYGRSLQDSMRLNNLAVPEEPALQAPSINLLNPEI